MWPREVQETPKKAQTGNQDGPKSAKQVPKQNKIEENHEQFIQNGSIATSSNLKLDALIKT